VKLSCQAPAKINRELRVGGLRADGFHEIRSRIVSIDLADRLTAEAADGLEFSCDDPAVPAGEANLMVRAANLLARRAGVTPRVRLHLEKRTPMGGGLGGGSADAAIALRLLARLWELPGAEEWLPQLAAELGSDVPFFLKGGQADVSGRGEIVSPVEDSPGVELLLLVPPISISTAAVYRAYAGRGRLPLRLEVESSARGPRFLGPNDLAPAVLQMEPRMEAYLESAARATPDCAISGSGASIVLCGAGPEAERQLLARHPEARLYRCQTLTRREYECRTNPTGGAS
jgi:4-diphosphocytidyl-2-C-methyl-D-erythritol kinase